MDEFDKKTYILLENNEVSIGRDPSNQISKPSVLMSINHSRILSLNGYAFIQDKGSLNGTYIKLIENKVYRIKNKMELEIGNMLYAFKKCRKIPEIFKIKCFLEENKSPEKIKIDKKKKFYIITKEDNIASHAINLKNVNIDCDQAYIFLIKNKFHIMPLESKYG